MWSSEDSDYKVSSDKAGEERYTSESEFEEQLDVLFPDDEGVHAMLRAYFDESHQHAEDFPAASVGVVMATGKEWRSFCRAWMAVLEHPDFDVRDKKGRRIFHTVDFESPEGRTGTVYEHWSDKKLKDFNNALLDTIAAHGIRCSAATVLVDEYKEVTDKHVSVLADDGKTKVSVPRRKLFGNKYSFCASWAMVFAAEEVNKYYPRNAQVAYYFESGGKYQHTIDQLYEVAIKDAGADFYRFFSKPQFVSKDYAVPLQAADKIAFEASKEVSHRRHPNPKEKYIEILSTGQKLAKPLKSNPFRQAVLIA